MGCSVLMSLAAVTKYHSLGGLNSRDLFLTVLEAGNSKIKVPADSVPVDSFLSGLQRAKVSLCPHMAFLWCVQEASESERSLSSSS